MQVIPTNIKGLDTLLGGGIPESNQVIVTGSPGSGKTLLSFEFAYRSAKAGACSIFFALEESTEDVIKNAKNTFKDFTDIDDLISKNLLIIDGADPSRIIRDTDETRTGYEFSKVVAEIESLIETYNAKRIVVDSLSIFELIMENRIVYRRNMLVFIGNLKRLKVTSILTKEMHSPERSDLSFKEDDFLFDGIIAMYQMGEKDKRMLGMEVIKMRGINHSRATAPYEITTSGLNIYAPENL
ncbi:MAG: ATPase domain-containing protein [Candidatus Micrarchaeaceae archaeon]